MAEAVIERESQVFSRKGPRSLRQFVTSRYDRMKTERTSFDSHWSDISAFMNPRRTRFTPSDRNKGDKRNQNIVDGTAKFAQRTLQAGLHSGLTSPARPWFTLAVGDKDLEKEPGVKQWLHDVTERMADVFNRSNIYQALPQGYGDLGLFGTTAIGIFKDDEDIIRAECYPCGSYVIGMDRRNMVAEFGREFEMTVLQIVEEYGGPAGQPAVPGADIDWTNISTHVKDAWIKGDLETTYVVRWAVMPNPEANPALLEARYKKFISVHFEVGGDRAAVGDKLLRVSGFDNFPILAPRWEVTGGDSYGTDCPGMTALGDTKQLQSMQKNKGKLLHKAVDPPLRGPSSLKTQKTSLVAGDITYVDAREGFQGLAPLHEVRLEGFQHLTADIREVQERVREAFYANLFLMMAYSDSSRGMQPITAAEVAERHEEKLLQLGPMLERTDKELLDPLIDLAFAAMLEVGLIPKAPDALSGVRLTVKYVSIMAQAQKLVGVVGHDRFLQTIVPLLEVNPAVADKIDWNEVVDEYAGSLGVNPKIVRSNDQANEIAAGRAQQQQAAAQAENMATMAKAAQSASQAPLETGGSVLDAVLGGAVAPGRQGLR